MYFKNGLYVIFLFTGYLGTGSLVIDPPPPTSLSLIKLKIYFGPDQIKDYLLPVDLECLF